MIKSINLPNLVAIHKIPRQFLRVASRLSHTKES